MNRTVLSARIAHETDTFSRKPATLESYRQGTLLLPVTEVFRLQHMDEVERLEKMFLR